VTNGNERVWSIVLAAGDGRRLAALTTDAQGNAVPKQFCSFAGMHAGNVIVQPRNCGTANGILLALLGILNRDPLAHVVFLPADHYVQDEATMATGLEQMVEHLQRHSGHLVLLGIKPDEADPELGYILPGAGLAPGLHAVTRFVEKPTAERAHSLLREGALWNSFIFAVQGATLLGLIRERLPDIVDAMETALARDAVQREGRALQALYEQLPDVDFSRVIVQGAEERLRVVGTEPCGWTDLGTPKRVIETLRRGRPAPAPWRRSIHMPPALVTLASQRALLQMVS